MTSLEGEVGFCWGIFLSPPSLSHPPLSPSSQLTSSLLDISFTTFLLPSFSLIHFPSFPPTFLFLSPSPYVPSSRSLPSIFLSLPLDCMQPTFIPSRCSFLFSFSDTNSPLLSITLRALPPSSSSYSFSPSACSVLSHLTSFLCFYLYPLTARISLFLPPVGNISPPPPWRYIRGRDK